ncbi:hypothetical protein B7486_01010 [cyanobacterium TDX16]|nr:hypothetical protein B7486_01010 [cyanobacterium TDX16]
MCREAWTRVPHDILKPILTWGEMVKFSHSVFALPFALFATFLASRDLPGGWPGWGRIGLIIACMVSARSFAMTFNRICDAALDARNPRTATRPIPAGKITLVQAWVFTAVAAIVFVIAAAGFGRFFGNWWPMKLSPVVLAALAFYSYCKRFTALAHFVLGAVIAAAPTAAWIAVNPATLDMTVVLLTLAVMFWIAGFDIIYACQDVEIDRRDGLFSIPARLGVAKALFASRACHVVTVAMLLGLGFHAELGSWYWAGAAATAVLLFVEQSLVRANDLSRVNLAFFTVNGFISLVLGAAGIVDVMT